MKYIRIDYNDDDRPFSEMIYECIPQIQFYFREISKEAALSFIKDDRDNAYYEIYSCYIKIEDNELDEFKKQVQAAIKVRHLNNLIKNV